MTLRDYGSIDDAIAAEFAAKDPEPKDEEPAKEPEHKEPDPVKEDPEKAKPEEIEKAKANAAFAQLRIEKEKAQREAEEKARIAKEEEDFINGLAQSSGFKSVDEFKKAVSAEITAKQAEKAGISPEAYAENEKLKARVKELEDERVRSSQQEGALRFKNAVDNFVADFGLGADGANQVFERLAKEGYTVEDMIASKSPTLLIKGAMTDVIENKALQSHMEREKTKLKVDDDKVSSSTAPKGETQPWEEALKADLAGYAAQNGYSR